MTLWLIIITLLVMSGVSSLAGIAGTEWELIRGKLIETCIIEVVLVAMLDLMHTSLWLLQQLTKLGFMCTYSLVIMIRPNKF